MIKPKIKANGRILEITTIDNRVFEVDRLGNTAYVVITSIKGEATEEEENYFEDLYNESSCASAI